MLFLPILGANLTYLGVENFLVVRFCASHITPIRETLIKTKVSLLYVVKNFKFDTKIALTGIYLSFITHLLLNKQKSSAIVFSKIVLLPPLTLKMNIVPNVQITRCKSNKVKE